MGKEDYGNSFDRRVFLGASTATLLGLPGISLGDVLRLPKRHPAWRRREAQSGSCTERENLAGDAKGKDAMGRRRGNCIHRR